VINFFASSGKTKVTALIYPKFATIRPLAMLAVLMVVFAGPASAGKLYKWVDENGEVRYSDRLPPQQSSKKHQQLNSQGVVLSTQEKAKSSDELAAEAEARRKREAEEAEAARLKAIQDQKDRVLLLTYTSVDEIEHARQDRISVIDSVIGLIENSVAATQEKLDGLNKSADRNYRSKNLEVPGGMAQKIEFLERKIANRNAQLETRLSDKAKINEKYDADLKRFQELKSAGN
jgi:hypothetical protein